MSVIFIHKIASRKKHPLSFVDMFTGTSRLGFFWLIKILIAMLSFCHVSPGFSL